MKNSSATCDLLNNNGKPTEKSTYIQMITNKFSQFYLTKQEIIMIILNILLFFMLIFVCIYVGIIVLAKANAVKNEIILVKAGAEFGGPGGEPVKTDKDKEEKLTFDDVITGMMCQVGIDKNNASLIASLQLKYSNGKFGRKYGGLNVESREKEEILFDKDALITKLILYKDWRLIDNPYAPKFGRNETALITGVKFQANTNKTYLCGERRGEIHIEQYPGYFLGHMTGLAVGYIDSLQFFWYKKVVKTSQFED